MCGRLLLQEATRAKLQWDERLPDDMQRRLTDWLNDLQRLHVLQFPRCMKPAANAISELHVFSDASEMAYGCCAYLRNETPDGEINVCLVFARCRIAPLKQVSLPRLELEGAVMAARMSAVLRDELDLTLNNATHWTDSQAVLKYIMNESRRFHTFIANRVSLIQQVTEVSQWRFVPGAMNPADLVSRGGSVAAIADSSWISGPDFLYSDPKSWPQTCISPKLHAMAELKSEPMPAHSALAEGETFVHPIDQLCAHYSDWHRLKKAVAWLLKIKAHLLKNTNSKFLTVRDLNDASDVIIMHAQESHYSDDLRRLKSNLALRADSSITSLDPHLSDGMLRVGGRLKRSRAMSHHPILIPHNHAMAPMIARHYHNRAHLGTEWVVSLIREEFWITRIRGVVKGISRNCVTCKRLFGKTCQQKMADLPSPRIEPYQPPFSTVGVDCFGPFLVKRARSEVKRYGCIITCFATRAIHIEVLDDLSTDSFLNGFRRFCARRGSPKRVFSDNGTNFVGGQRELHVNSDKIKAMSLAENIDWVFNTPTASHMGGVWERMIRTIRKVLAAVIPSAHLSDEGLRTVLCEVEAIVNSRPLVKTSDDPKDNAAITPNHLILLNQVPIVAPGEFTETDRYKKQWRCVQHLANQFWKQWIKQYLPTLQPRGKWRRTHQNLGVGDLVLVTDETTPRGVWPMGIVREVKVSEDGLVRLAKVHLKVSNSLWRPIHKLVLLEASDSR